MNLNTEKREGIEKKIKYFNKGESGFMILH